MRISIYGGEDAIHNDIADIADILHRISYKYFQLEIYSEGLDYQTRALQMRISIYGGEDAIHNDIADILHRISYQYFQLEIYLEGLDYQNRA